MPSDVTTAPRHKPVHAYRVTEDTLSQCPTALRSMYPLAVLRLATALTMANSKEIYL